MKIAVAGGDERMLTTSSRLEAAGYECIRIALGKESLPPEEIPEDVAAVILPLPYAKGGRLCSPTSDKQYDVGEILKAGNKSTVFFGGGLPSECENYVDYSASESFRLKNAVATAEGAILLALSGRKRTLFNSNALVIGYGRIGAYLTRLLLAFGAKVTVAARREESRLLAELDSATPVPIDSLPDAVADADLIFNTVPYPLVSGDALSKAKNDALIIELASPPGGFESPCEGMIKASGLPGRFFPTSAGDTVFEAIYPILCERGITP